MSDRQSSSMSALAVGAASVAGAYAVRRISSKGSFRSASPRTVEVTEQQGNGKNVGILAMEVYTPSTFVKQEALEEHAGVAKGRYTIGLGQEGLAICGDAEDVNSLCLTVVHSLLEK